MSYIKYNGLDFGDIKNNLKEFLKSQDKFKDYNFEGTSLSILLDVLSYNTAYNAFYLNMLSSEMFLDSATLPSAVASRAKQLGHIPGSAKALKATVDMVVTTNDPANATPRLYLNRDTIFRTSVVNQQYQFVPERPVYVDLSSSGTYVIRNLSLIQGTRLIHSYTVDKTLPIKQRFVIPNKMVDLSTLVITVVKSATNSTEDVYTPTEDVNVLSPSTRVYFIQPYEVVFGDDILGKSPENGNIIKLDYLVSSGNQAEGAKQFVCATSFNLGPNIRSSNSVSVVEPAYGHVDPESLESIKLLAPRAYTAQNRAVTKLDYETLLKRDMPIIEHISVWGGDEADPPIYGKVFCSIKPKSGYALNTDDKTRLIENFIKPRSILAMEVELVEPDYLYIVVSTQVSFFADRTNKQEGDIKKLVIEGIKQFKKNNISGFDSDFRLSKLTGVIDGLEKSIESNSTKTSVRHRIIPSFYKYFNYEIKLNNPIDRGDATNDTSAINSTEFVNNGVSVKMADDGKGKLYLYYNLNNKRIVVNTEAGTVDYETGKILIQNISVDSIPNSKNYIDVLASLKGGDVIAYRNQLLRIEDEDVYVETINLNKIRLS